MNSQTPAISCGHLADLLRFQASNASSEAGYFYLDDRLEIQEHQTYAILDQQARSIARRLIEAGQIGKRALILCSPGSSYLASLFGCLYAGVVAVTAYPPRPRRNDERLETVIADSQASVALVDAQLLQRRDQFSRQASRLSAIPWLDADAIRAESSWESITFANLDRDSLAILQYTSGSTANPRGVQLSHRNLMHNLAIIQDAFALQQEETCGVCWLPPYHDMGLIGGLLQPLFIGKSTYIVSPAAFIQQPLRWLQAISRYGATISGGPNFAYDLCVDRVSAEEAGKLDLSRWALAFNGAEPILPETLQRFAAKFAISGFRAEAFFPCYGLAEATLLVAGGPANRKPRVHTFSDDRQRVSCGRVPSRVKVVIVDPKTRQRRADGQEGEIWIAGESVSRGYWRHESDNSNMFAAQIEGDSQCYLRSGDLGYLLDGELYVSGRCKDLIVLRGRNFHPQDLEAAIDRCHDHAVIHGSVAVVVPSPADQRPNLVLMHEIARHTPASKFPTIVQRIQRELANQFEIRPDLIALLRSGSLPRTSSGKPRRSEAAKDFIANSLRPLYRWQATHDAVSSTANQMFSEPSPTKPQTIACGAAETAFCQGEVSTVPLDTNRTSAQLQSWLAGRIAKQMNMPIEQVDVHAPFAEFGLDSVSAVLIAGEMEQQIGIALPATLFYDSPNIAAAAQAVIQLQCAAACKQTKDEPEPPKIESPNPQRWGTTNADPGEPKLDHGATGDGSARHCYPEIAIVAAACRLPGCDTLDSFWHLIQSGKSAITTPPADRHAHAFARKPLAGWIKAIDQFDAELFGITPKEACWIDPQHRLLLETIWQALENAGWPPNAIPTRNTGVYVGISSNDYSREMVRRGVSFPPYGVTGNALSMAAHRISYQLNLTGPSLAIDTACSSSLVAVHQACRALETGDCQAAIVAGVNLILSGDVTSAFDDAGMLADDGYCKSFDSRADGYVRSEGCVGLVLKKLSDARRDGDPIMSVIVGSAINQDGRSNGITAPNKEAQQAVLKTALSYAKVSPTDVTLIETHGTGTILGDPIEIEALRAVYDSPGTADQSPLPCVIGSLKANIGHCEAASGIAGLLKVVLAIQHRCLPPLTHFETLNPHISLTDSRFVFPKTAEPWPVATALAAVSSFGLGGTNAHVLVAANDTVKSATPEPRTVPGITPQCVAKPNAETQPMANAPAKHVALANKVPAKIFFAYSAQSRAALRAWSKDAAASLKRQPATPLRQWSRMLLRSRTTHPQRATILANDMEGLLAGLDAVASGRTVADVLTSSTSSNPPASVGWMFSGQGGQWPGMGSALYQASRTFRQWVDQAEAALQGWHLAGMRDFLLNRQADASLEQPCSQSALFVLQVGISGMLQNWLGTPVAVLGHSLGEYAAATSAGVMSPLDGLRLTAQRAAWVTQLPREGAMCVVFADAKTLRPWLDAASLSVAAINAPEQTVLAGSQAAIQQVSRDLQQHGYRVIALPLANAFHSPLIDPLLPKLDGLLRTLHLLPPKIRFVSGVAGDVVIDPLQTPEYWLRHTRQPVRFADALQRMRQSPCDYLLEIGPHPTLCGLATLNGIPPQACVAAMDRQASELSSLQRAVARLFVAGVNFNGVAAAEVLAGGDERCRPCTVTIPNYAFQRRSYWLPGADSMNKQHQTHVPSPADSAASDVKVLADRDAPAGTDDLAELEVLRAYTARLPQVDAIVDQYFRETLAELGCCPQTGDILDEESLSQSLGIQPPYDKYLHRMFQVLAEAGDLSETASGWKVNRSWRPACLAGTMADALLGQDPSLVVELRLATRCGRALPQILTGRTDPLSVLMPGGDWSDVQDLYEQSPMAIRANRLVADLVSEAVPEYSSGATLPEGDRQSAGHSDPVRILEVGAGTGGTTAGVLRQLQTLDIPLQYCFTDNSPVFTALAEQRFGSEGPLQYGLFDLEQTAVSQGWQPNSFHIVLAANVVHATRSVRESLQAVLQMLIPGGKLILLESTGKRRLLDLIFGTTPGWWRFRDRDLRPDHPLLEPERWREVLTDCGFDDVSAQPVFTTPGYATACQSVLAARKPLAEMPRNRSMPSAPATLQQRPRMTAKTFTPGVRRVNETATDSVPTGDAELLLNAPESQRLPLLEAFLRQQLATVTGLEAANIDLDQPVNNLGVDSLMAIQLKNRIESELRIAIPMVLFLQGLSLRELMVRLLERIPAAGPLSIAMVTESADPADVKPRIDQPADRQPDALATRLIQSTASDLLPAVEISVPSRQPAIGAEQIKRVLGPLSIGQQALWTIHQVAPLSAAYNFAFVARALPPADVVGGSLRLREERLAQAFQWLAQRHPMLQTCYQIIDQQPQRVFAPGSIPLPVVQVCSGWSDEQVLQWVRDFADQPFDLQTGPIIRFGILRHEGGDLLSIAMHHIAADLWSMDQLVRELCRLYFQPGTTDTGKPVAEFGEYVSWERELLSDQEGERLWKFWREKLSDAPTELQLPVTFARPARQTFDGQSHDIPVSAELTEALRALATREKTTLFTTMLAIYQAFLSRICNQDDFLVGTVVANRHHSQWEEVVGYFLNQLVLRTRIGETDSFRDLLAQTRHEMLEALEHSSFPFTEAVRRLEISRDPSRAPLIQTMFVWDKPRHLHDNEFTDQENTAPALRLQPLLMEQRGAAFDLTCIVYELEDRLSLTLRYNRDLFSAAAIASLADGFLALLKAVVNDPDQSVASAPLLSPAAYQQQIVQWNETFSAYEASTALDLFQRQATANPDANAIETTTATWSYQELDHYAAKLAQKLWEADVQAGQFVGIALPRGPQAIGAILAIWKVNAAYVPLDPDYPDARLQYICKDAQLRCVITNQPERFAMTTISPDVAEIAHVSLPFSHAVAVGADQPAYMIYTSGSTGNPKGAVLRHRGLCNLSLAQKRAFRVRSTDRILQFASLSFDASIFEIVMALHHGACLCLPDHSAGQPFSQAIVQQLRTLGVTIATLPPSILAMHSGDDLPALHTVISAGEACTESCLDHWLAQRRFFNAYGPTEATVWSTLYQVNSRDHDPGQLPIGRPITNCKAYVLDRNQQPMPTGVPGELYLAGPGLALHYHRQPIRTAESFLPNPFSSDHDATIYRTGDLARWTFDGQLQFLGRIDQQVKISGHRIEPDEVSSVIANINGIRHAVVVPQTCTRGNGDQATRLVAYFVPARMPGPSIAQLRSGVRSRLPEFMVPACWVPLPELPLTTNGKVDTAALPSPSDQRLGLQSDYVAARNPTETRLVSIWEDILHVDRVGVQDNFFDLGGASLQAVQAAEAAQRAGFALSAEQMFQFQTIEQLASAIDQEQTRQFVAKHGQIGELLRSPGSQSSDPCDPCEPGDVPKRAPVSATQNFPTKATVLTAQAVPLARDPQTAVGNQRMVIESLGTYLPPRTQTTAEVVSQCAKPLNFPLEQMSGIVSRHVAGEHEFSLDLARQAALDCLARSRFQAADLDLLIACNISRYDGPEFQISYEPTTAATLARQLGATQAWSFDVCNACAGFFTALEVVRCLLVNRVIRRAMVVSGEYISHLARTAQLEIDGFLDPRLACLTLGDAGAATILELTDGGAGFAALDLYTAGKHHELCVAKLTDQPHGGAIMLTDAVRASAVTLKHSIAHAHRTLQQHHWDPGEVRKLVMHQTSSTTLAGAVEELNRSYGRDVCDRSMAVNNLAECGNTASTTHWLAVMEQIRRGEIDSGDQVVFAISGSGQTVGTALYRFDDLPQRLCDQSEKVVGESSEPITDYGFSTPCIELVGATVVAPSDDGVDTSNLAVNAASQILQDCNWDRNDVGLVIHAGVYKTGYLSEPAVAAIVAGELEINDDLPGQDPRRTLAFDLSDGGSGPLTASLIAGQMLQACDGQQAIITCSEIENNAGIAEATRRGLAELGSALALRKTSRGVGFGGVRTTRFADLADCLQVQTRRHDSQTILEVTNRLSTQPGLVDRIATFTREFLRQHGLTAEQLAVVLPPCFDANFPTALTQELGISLARCVVPSTPQQGEPFTSTLAIQWKHLTEQGFPPRGSVGLIIGVAAGVEVTCALYHF